MTPLRTFAALLALLLLTVSCTDDGSSTEPDSDGGDDARVIEHRYGETEVTGSPERVVSLGLTDADPLLALGVDPVAIRPGYDVEGVGPWAREELGATNPKILDTQQIDLERVASLNPDLIVAMSTEVDRQMYEKLSKIAPTIVRPEGAIDYGVPWEVTTTMIGNAVGRPEKAQEVIEKTKVAINQAMRENPRIDGTNGAVIRPNPQGGWYVYTPADKRGQFMFELGSNLPPKLAKKDDGSSYWIDISEENTDLLEADVLVAIGQKKQFTQSKLFRELAVVDRGGVVYVPPKPVGQALAYTTVLSIPFALDKLAPRMSEALD